MNLFQKLLERERRKGEEKKEELKKRGEQLYRNKKVLFERKEKMEQERRERTIGKDFREKVEEGIKLSTFLQSLEKDLCEKRKEKEKIQREIEEVQRENKEEEEKEEELEAILFSRSAVTNSFFNKLIPGKPEKKVNISELEKRLSLLKP